MKNMFSLALQGLLRKKQQTILVVSILTISFAFAVMMISYTSSIVKTNEEYRYDTYGECTDALLLDKMEIRNSSKVQAGEKTSVPWPIMAI